MSLMDCALDKICGVDPAGGPRECDEQIAVYVEYTDVDGCELTSVLCHKHAALLRAGADIFDEAGTTWDALPYTVTHWRSV